MYWKFCALVVVVLHSLLLVECYIFECIPENEEMFTPCSKPSFKDIDSMLDLSNFTMEYIGDAIHWEGSVRVIWNVEPTDRIEAFGSFYVYRRGTWQPTLFSMRRMDVCKVMWNKDEFWHNIAAHVPEEDHICLNNPGTIYHFDPIDITLKFEAPTPLSDGRYKTDFNFEVYDTNNHKKPESICYELICDVVKTSS